MYFIVLLQLLMTLSMGNDMGDNFEKQLIRQKIHHRITQISIEIMRKTSHNAILCAFMQNYKEQPINTPLNRNKYDDILSKNVNNHKFPVNDIDYSNIKEQKLPVGIYKDKYIGNYIDISIIDNKIANLNIKSFLGHNFVLPNNDYGIFVNYYIIDKIGTELEKEQLLVNDLKKTRDTFIDLYNKLNNPDIKLFDFMLDILNNDTYKTATNVISYVFDDTPIEINTQHVFI